MQSWLNWYSIGSDAKLVPVGEKPTFLTDIWVRMIMMDGMFAVTIIEGMCDSLIEKISDL
jgi:hypothetical protein